MRPGIPRAVVAWLTLLTAAGCLKLGPDYEPPEPAFQIPDAYQQAEGEGTHVLEAATGSLSLSADEPVDPGAQEWWRVFDDAELDLLVRDALERNLDLLEAETRVREIRSRLRVARSGRLPGLTLDGGASRSSPAESSLPGGSETPIDSYDLAVAASFELDLWGRLARASEAARADLLQAEENRRAAAQTVAAETVRQVLTLRALDRRLEVAGRQVQALRESLELVDRRYRRGLVSALDVRQARRALASARALIPALRQERGQVQQGLALLTGRYPRVAPLDERNGDVPVFLPPVPEGLPSELLRRRPDLRASEAALQAASARIGQARAARFPTLRLTGAFGYASGELESLFDPGSELWSLAAGLTQPLFDAGRLSAEEQAARARHERARIDYARRLLNAFAEVEGALLTRREQHDRARSLRTALVEAQATLRTAEDRYRRGLIDYLRVLEAQQARYQIEDGLVRTELAVQSNHVALHRALGGGWADPHAPTLAGEPEAVTEGVEP